MCQVFISADPQSYESRTRSVRLHGVVTSIRLENLHWEVLEEIGARDGLSVTQLITKLYDELIQERGTVGNFSSFLRVSALRYLALVAQQRIPADRSIPLDGLSPLPPDGSPPTAGRTQWPSQASSTVGLALPPTA